MYVHSIIKKKGDTVIAVAPDDPVSTASQLLHENHIGATLVRESNGDIVGILSERDIVRGLARHKNACLDMPVRDLMTSPVISCQPTASTDEIMQLMTDRRIRHLPVMERDRLIGIISIGDVVKQRILEIENESEALKQYIATG